MKLYQHTIFLLLCNFTTLSSQGNNSNGVQSDLRLVDLYENIKNKIGKKTYSNQKIKGTPYFEKTFKLAEVEYFGELITDKIYIRFNAYNDEMEIGMGIHGEPGIRRGKLKSADEITEELSNKILDDINLSSGDEISVLINSLGATPHEELFITANKLNKILKEKNIINKKSYVGRYATSMEMAGMSITILKLDNELEKLLLDKASCPFWF